MAIMRNGRPLTPREQKAYVMRVAGWTTQQYNKEYDKLRNRARNYERANGLAKGSINVADMLARSQSRVAYGDKQTTLYRAVSATTSSSTGARLTARQIQRAQANAEKYISDRYGNVLAKSNLVSASYEAFLKANPNATAAAREEFITATIKGAKSLGAAATAYRNEMGAKGIIVPWQPDTL